MIIEEIDFDSAYSYYKDYYYNPIDCLNCYQRAVGALYDFPYYLANTEGLYIHFEEQDDFHADVLTHICDLLYNLRCKPIGVTNFRNFLLIHTKGFYHRKRLDESQAASFNIELYQEYVGDSNGLMSGEDVEAWMFAEQVGDYIWKYVNNSSRFSGRYHLVLQAITRYELEGLSYRLQNVALVYGLSLNICRDLYNYSIIWMHEAKQNLYKLIIGGVYVKAHDF